MQRSQFSNTIFAVAFGSLLAACGLQSPSATEIPTRLASTPFTVTATSIAEIQESTEFIEGIKIQEPGSDSRIASPILLKMVVSPSATVVRIELASQAGSLLARKIIIINQDSQAGTIELNVPINFEINRATLEARVIASIEDEYGRLKALDSVAITLLQDGVNDLQSSRTENQIEIASPEANETIRGGNVTIAGQAASQPGRALNIELITREGRVLEFAEVYPTFEDGSVTGTFSLTLDYEVEGPTWVLIGVAERQSGFIIHYASAEVLLLP